MISCPMPRPQISLRSLFVLTGGVAVVMAGLADHTWTFDEAVLGR
jgi:hypothetical protein